MYPVQYFKVHFISSLEPAHLLWSLSYVAFMPHTIIGELRGNHHQKITRYIAVAGLFAQGVKMPDEIVIVVQEHNKLEGIFQYTLLHLVSLDYSSIRMLDQVEQTNKQVQKLGDVVEGDVLRKRRCNFSEVQCRH